LKSGGLEQNAMMIVLLLKHARAHATVNATAIAVRYIF
jgi:hypothetical protein